MLRLLVRPALFVAAIFSFAILVMMVAPGRAVNVPDLSGAFGFAACPPPCWAGIVVGQTPFNDVSTVFERNVAAREKQISFANNGATYWGISEPNAARERPATAFSGNLLAQAGAAEVTYIHLNVELPMWYLLLTLGDPAEVEMHQQFAEVQRVEMVVRWNLPNARAAATLRVTSPEEWGLYAPVTSLTLAAADDRDNLGFALRSHRIIGAAAWRGFIPFEDYVRAAALDSSERACGECVQAGL